MKIKIRKATLKDYRELYRLGNGIEELRVIDGQAFMTPKEFKSAIENRKGIFLIAEDGGKIAGFAYSSIDEPKLACMVYDAVIPEYRGMGIASRLTRKRDGWLEKRGIRSVYALATNPHVIKILKHWGYKEGKRLTWMYKEIG